MTRTDVVPRTSTTRAVLVVGLLLAAVGTLGEYLTGVPGFPTIPPGPIILTVAAALVVFLPWRWAPVLGLAVAVFILGGAIVSGVPPALLLAPGAVGPFLSAVVQLGGLVVAIVAGLAWLVRGR